jgi:hypothetical protein
VKDALVLFKVVSFVFVRIFAPHFAIFLPKLPKTAKKENENEAEDELNENEQL